MSARLKPEDRPARILIVDDERTNRQLLEVLLEPEGFDLRSAASGEEALALVAEDPPDLILLDVMMPGMDGYQVAVQIKANAATRNIPVIMVTALDDRGARILGLNAGAEDFLSKPVDRAELSVRVRNLLRLKAYGDYHDRYGQMLEGEVGSRAADLVESERLYRSTFDAAPVGIVHVGLDGRWLRVNQRLCDLLGYSREELMSAIVQDTLHSQEEPGAAESLSGLIEGTVNRYVVDERSYRRNDGSLVWARVNMSAHRDAEGRAQHLIAVIEDITERRALEEHVRQATKMDAIGQLASGIAHDFNNLLSVVLSYSELLADELKDDDPMRADLAEIRTAGLRAAELTRQLLAFSRKQVLQPKLVDLGDIVACMEKMLRRLIGEDIELTATSATGRAKVLVDPGQMEQVVMNLAVNARDAMPQGGRLTIDTTEVLLDDAYAERRGGMLPGPHVMLTVTDEGIGMDGATQARIFEPFFTTKGAGKGTGLGLATVFGVVQQSGGTIRVYSKPGKGTTFEVFFPVADEVEELRPSTAAEDGPSLRGNETVLLVEDEDSVRLLARTILRRFGYHVLEAQSPGDAVLLCEQHGATIDLLLTDVVMPLISGRQLADRLLLVRPGMKVLYMSGYMDDAILRHGALDSTIAFLQKPITPKSLAGKVREALGSRAE